MQFCLPVIRMNSLGQPQMYKQYTVICISLNNQTLTKKILEIPHCPSRK